MQFPLPKAFAIVSRGPCLHSAGPDLTKCSAKIMTVASVLFAATAEREIAGCSTLRWILVPS